MNEPPGSFELKTIRVIPLNDTKPFFLGFKSEYGPCKVRVSEDRRHLAVFNPGRSVWIENLLLGHNSWCTAWENEYIDVEVDQNKDGTWKSIQKWDDFCIYLSTL